MYWPLSAGAAALAALHPIDMDNKFGMGLGYGNYRNASAMSMGLFYRPQDNLMFSVGGSMGNGENMVNAGVTIALDKGVSTSKAVMARNIRTLSEENAAVREENATMKAQMDNQEEKLNSQEAEIRELKKALANLAAKVGN
ncbi:MAG: YadA-like family protein [Acidaminococcaceae bacterium]|nr:YadA-like family protein [Acidaminococcaceae bacterium]MBQ9319783.1 YadA-like family protein [Acidaminococcaceae bacterium]